MALTRTDDKLDKNITRLLMQSPLGLTIGDITAAAKCTPQTARKSLARIGAEKDASGQLYLLRDDDEQATETAQPEPEAEQAPATEPTEPAPAASTPAPSHWQPPRPWWLPTVPSPESPPAAQPEQAPAETTIEQIKPGDLVTPVNVDRYEHYNERELLLGKELLVYSVFPGKGVNIYAGTVGGKKWCWFSDDLRVVSAFNKPEQSAEVTLPGLQQRILTLLGQHRGLTALRIAEDLHADPESVHDALHDLSHLVASRPLALPEIQVWEVRG